MKEATTIMTSATDRMNGESGTARAHGRRGRPPAPRGRPRRDERHRRASPPPQGATSAVRQLAIPFPDEERAPGAASGPSRAERALDLTEEAIRIALMLGLIGLGMLA